MFARVLLRHDLTPDLNVELTVTREVCKSGNAASLSISRDRGRPKLFLPTSAIRDRQQGSRARRPPNDSRLRSRASRTRVRVRKAVNFAAQKLKYVETFSGACVVVRTASVREGSSRALFVASAREPRSRASWARARFRKPVNFGPKSMLKIKTYTLVYAEAWL